MIAEAIERAAAVLREAPSVALACHVNPDPDALGSMLGLSTHLRERGTQTVCSFPNDPFDPPRWLDLLPGRDALVHPREFPDRPAVMVTCDAASMDRLAMLGHQATAVTKLPKATAAHHLHGLADQAKGYRIAIAVDRDQPVLGDHAVAHHRL